LTLYRVTLQPNVLETIEEEILNTAADSPEQIVETGGWLWSPQGVGWWGSDGIDVQEASGPGLDAEKRYDELTFQTGHMFDLDVMFRRDGLELCGGWHTHPSGDSQPSEADLNRIGYVLDMRAIWESRTQRALEIIITRRPYGRGWEAWPWVFYKGPSRVRHRGCSPRRRCPTPLKEIQCLSQATNYRSTWSPPSKLLGVNV
jgi:proteasome lid subunit RPN8/RPN11